MWVKTASARIHKIDQNPRGIMWLWNIVFAWAVAGRLLGGCLGDPSKSTTCLGDMATYRPISVGVFSTSDHCIFGFRYRSIEGCHTPFAAIVRLVVRVSGCISSIMVRSDVLTRSSCP
jgi:hypothetical protein